MLRDLTSLTAKVEWYNERRLYRQPRHRRSAEFWRGKLETDESNPRHTWKTVDVLLDRGRLPASSATDVEVFIV